MRRTVGLLCFATVLACRQEQQQPAAPATASTAPAATEVALALPEEVRFKAITERWSGDLDGIVQRRVLRVLVIYNRTGYFIDRGAPRGIAYDAMKEFETLFNKERNLGKAGIHAVFVPVSRDKILDQLASGYGDVAIGALTVTPERSAKVDFTTPVFSNVSDIVVTGPGAEPIGSLDDLAGKEVAVREGGVQHQSLSALNDRFRREGRKEITFRFMPSNLEDEDLLEMTSAGLVKITVINQSIAEFWKQVLPEITLHPGVAPRTGADIAWAIRKNTPQLKKELDEFIETHRVGTKYGNILLQKYLKSTKFVKNSTSAAELKKYAELRSIFEKYGEQYAVDWILMAAQGYQESGLDQKARSRVGAVGVMQLMPGTGRDMKVGNIGSTEPNVHAGIKYMRFMIDQYYKDEPMDELNKMLFTFASYNAGPSRIQRLRQEASRRGLNPNVWFNNVEYVVAEEVGREPVVYVSNIYKYYVAYKLIDEQMKARSKAREAVAAANPGQ